MISVSIDGLFGPALAGGKERASLDALWPRVGAAHAELMGRRGGDIGFLEVGGHPEAVRLMVEEAKRLRSLADDLIVLGIGGSSLGGQALAQALGWTSDRPVRLHFVDNVDPDTFATLLERLDPTRAATVVITKSGGTVETLAQLLILKRWFRASVGAGEARQRMTFVTDPQKGWLRQIAQSEGIRAFEIPTNIGGRFSALTPVGLLPIAFLGIDVGRIVSGAAAMVERVTAAAGADNPACLFAAGTLFALEKLGATSLVMMPYSDALRLTSAWFVQLWAESLGKRIDRQGKVVFAGQTPIPAVGATDQHAQVQLFVEGPRDKIVTIVKVEAHRKALPIPDEFVDHEQVKFLHGRDLGELLEAERRGTRAALLDAGVGVIDLTVPRIDEESLGSLLILLEASCACMGLAMGIDPFDQPGVEAGKRMAFGLLGRGGYEEDAARVAAREALENRV